MVGLFHVSERWITAWCKLPTESYRSAWLLGAWFRGLSLSQAWPVLVILGLWMIGRTWRTSWTFAPGGAVFRVWITIVVASLAWINATSDLNLYLNQWHTEDRWLMVLLIPLVFWRPAMVLPFLIQTLLFISQYNIPLGQYLWADQRPLVNQLTLFLVFLTLRRLMPFSSRLYVLVALCLLAGNYWLPGWLKLRSGWLTFGHIGFLLSNAYGAGWLPSLSEFFIGRAVQILLAFDWPIRLGTLVLELGAFMILWRRWTVTAFLLGWLCFHTATFLLLGYLFWKWMLLELAVLGLFVCRSS